MSNVHARVQNFDRFGAMGIFNQAADLIARCNENARLAREKAEREASSSEPLAVPENNVTQLPMWPDVVRGMPNGMLRSALFGALKKGPRRHMKSEEIASQGDTQLCYTGEQLDQGDQDLWQGITHIFREQAMGSQCRFKGYTMLKLLGMTVASFLLCKSSERSAMM